jgi:hypothetical protein
VRQADQRARGEICRVPGPGIPCFGAPSDPTPGDVTRRSAFRRVIHLKRDVRESRISVSKRPPANIFEMPQSYGAESDLLDASESAVAFVAVAGVGA